MEVPQLIAWVQPHPIVKETIASDGALPSWIKLQDLLSFYCRNESFQNFLSIADISKQESFQRLNKYVLVKKWAEEGEESMISLYRTMLHIQLGIQYIIDISSINDITDIGDHIFASLVFSDSSTAVSY